MIFIIVVILFALAIYQAMGILADFRKSVKVGDVVGVKFGEVVLNRTVKSINNGELMVLNLKADRLESVPLNKVYISDKWSDLDSGV
jgi:hypothetical protein